MCFNVDLLLKAKDCDGVFVSNDPINWIDPLGLFGGTAEITKPGGFVERVADSIKTDISNVVNDPTPGARADTAGKYASAALAAITGGAQLNYLAIKNPGIYEGAVCALEGALSPGPPLTAAGVAGSVSAGLGSSINNGPPESRYHNPQPHNDYRTAP